MPWGRQSPCRTPQGAELSILVHSSKGGCSVSRPPLRGFAGERPGPEHPSSEVLHAETEGKGSGHCGPSTRGCQSSVQTAALPFQEQTPSRAPVRILGTPAEEAPPERTGAPLPGGVGSASTRLGGTRPVSGCRSSDCGPWGPVQSGACGIRLLRVCEVSALGQEKKVPGSGGGPVLGASAPSPHPACLSSLPGPRPSLPEAGPALPLPWDWCGCILGRG